jgi:zinc transport system substrate-binding protein
MADNLPEIAVFGSHPVYQYLGQAYGINIISEHWEPGVMPSDEQWKEFKHNLDHNPANLMLWEGQPSEEMLLKLRELKLESIVFDPCANKPNTGDFISVMKQNINNLKKYIEDFC